MKSQESSKFKLNYRKTRAIDLDEWVNATVDASQNSPYKIAKLQQYNPIYSHFFELNEQNYDSISLNHKHQICGLNSVLNTDTNCIETKPVFTKFSPLIDPMKYMIGKDISSLSKDISGLSKDSEPKDSSTILDKSTILDFELPKYNIEKTDSKSNTIPNTDAFFSFLTSSLLNHHDFKHGIDYYGSYLGIQERFRINIEDDLEYLNNSDFFMENVGTLFTLENYTPHNEYANFGSRGNKMKIQVSDTEDIDILADEIIDEILDLNEIDQKSMSSSISPLVEELSDLDLSQCKDSIDKIPKNTSSSSYSSSNSSNDSQLNYSTDEDKDLDIDSDHDSDHEDPLEQNTLEQNTLEQDPLDDTKWATDSESSSSCSSSSQDYDPDKETHAYIHNFPVQMICLEKCDGTFDELFVKQLINPENGASALFQIVMTLILYQKTFHFTHNDLHTNNVMFMNTDQEFLYYTYNAVHYKVPTYGRIFKIIDFGRAIYKYQDKQFCSESFAHGGDAATQYNCEPYFNKNKPRLEPNYSFDLCRLGCSIFDFIIDEDEVYNDMDDLQKTIHRWCLDDSKKNILYKKNGEERYPNFKLYKMIARTVHHHTPQEQMEFPFFKQYMVTELNADSMNIDVIPKYLYNC